MKRSTSVWALAGALASAVSFVSEAEAAPMPQGTFTVAAERMVATNFHFYDGGMQWNNQFFGAPGFYVLDTPRLGLDYFVIDGLSLGGHLSFGFYANDGNSAAVVTFLPRVGYAFSLSRSIDFWPRGGIGVIAGDAAADTGLIELEGMFLANIKDYFAIEFGPAIDIPFSNAYADVVIGANAGMLVKF